MKWIRFTPTRLALLCALLLTIHALIALPTTPTTDAAPRPTATRPTAAPVAPRPTATPAPDRLVPVAKVKDMGEGGYTATIDGRTAMLFPRTTTAPQLLDGDWFYSTLAANFTIKWSVK